MRHASKELNTIAIKYDKFCFRIFQIIVLKIIFNTKIQILRIYI